ncbi:hypothetical protein GR183_01935 [Stappia sp. GBMRC 2046]|uniref:Uncharacterized protein n=1 Tax=Stappia sediminis TaxID=2692190 RepID=A0A7X3LRB9_9HYPH|nr:hypothetical protein [Stappia sediminis]MXN63650.1 hypothetical protein [Stappia sediminis]
MRQYCSRQRRAENERLANNPFTPATYIPLKGNHEDCLLRFLVDPAANAYWLTFGDTQTINSYGISVSD